MKVLFTRFMNLKIRTKFMLSCIVVILFTVLMVSIINYKISESTLKNNTSKFSEYLMEQLVMNLESRTRDVEDFIFLQFNSSGLNKQIRTDSRSADSLEIYKKRRSIDDFLYNMLNAKQYVQSVLIVDRYGEKYFRSKDNAGLGEDDLSSRLDVDKIKNLWGNSLWQYGNDRLILVERALFDPETTEYLGLIVAAVDKSHIGRLYENIDRVESSRIILLNGSNQVMLSDDALSLDIANYLSQNNFYESNEENGSFRYKNKEYISALRSSPNKKWKILNVITVKELTRSSDQLKIWTALVCLASFLIALLIAMALSKNITENIRLLVKNIKKISEGNFNSRIEPKSLDEVGMLAQEFNLMSEKINNLIHTVYHEQLMKKNAEFKALQFEYSALQAQMNPHFLYNTLETINSMAKLKGEAEISEMVFLLGNLLRESIRRKSSIISLREEVGYIKNYLEIQKKTYGDKVEIIYDIDEELMDARVPKFILQPLVENAIIHGIEAKIGRGVIIINCFSHENTVIIEIADNGAGMDGEKLKRILDTGGEDEDHGHRHTKVGIKSVDKRIKILYGEEYGLKVSSDPGKGTRVEIVIPLRMEDMKTEITL